MRCGRPHVLRASGPGYTERVGCLGVIASSTSAVHALINGHCCVVFCVVFMHMEESMHEKKYSDFRGRLHAGEGMSHHTEDMQSQRKN